jgi:hypothetical protein
LQLEFPKASHEVVISNALNAANGEIAEKLDAAIGTIRTMLDDEESTWVTSTSPLTAGNTGWPAKKARRCGC